MSDWLDDDGNLLGEWQVCTAEEYVHVLDVVLGPERSVFSSRTEVGERLPDGTYRDRVMDTEWGRQGDATPLARCSDHWDYYGERTHTDYRFVPRAT